MRYQKPTASRMYGKYRHRCKRKNYYWGLTLVEFERLTQMKCFYCGLAPTKKERRYVYNGIDRKNPKRGYEPENCVTCCYQCNMAKGSMSFVEFKTWVKRVAQKLNRK